MATSTSNNGESHRLQAMAEIKDLWKSGNLLTAQTKCRELVQSAPDFFQAHFHLGNISYAMEELDAAIEAYTEAIRLKPNQAEIHNNLAAAYAKNGQSRLAIGAFKKAIKIKPNQASALKNLSNIFVAEQNYDKAAETLRLADKARPNHAETLRLLYPILLRVGKSRECISVLKRLLDCSPKDVDALVACGAALYGRRKYDQALDHFSRALALEPKRLDIQFHLAEIMEQNGHHSRARTIFQELLHSDVDDQVKQILRLRIACVFPIIAESRASITEQRKTIRKVLTEGPDGTISNPYAVGGFTNFFLAYQGLNDRKLQESLSRFYLSSCPGLSYTAPHCTNYRYDRRRKRIRLAVVSSFMYDHTVGHLNRGLIENLDRNRFELVLVRCPLIPEGDPIADHLASISDSVLDVPDDLEEARHLIARIQADILYYPEIGMDDMVYFLAFARLAPVQCVAWGHPVTTGVPNMDYFISVDDMEPEASDRHYSEKLVRLEGLSVCYTRPPAPMETEKKVRLGIDPNLRAYLCAQSLFKVHPDFDQIIARLLEQDRDGIVYFIGLTNIINRQFLDRVEKNMGKNTDRVRILPRVSSQMFLSLLQNADVVLDVPNWSGGKTSLESFAMGTPIVHWPGRFMRGRHTLALYKCMGLTDCVVDSTEAYAETAFSLARQTDFKADVRRRIKENSHKLFDNVSTIKELESFFELALAELP